jgi:pimeloyl-ACP methyl ester carboxylesterase
MARDPGSEEPVRVAARGLVFDVWAGGPPDGPPVLLLHGFPQHAGEFARVVPALWAAGLRTYAVDQRGYSPGARPAGVEAYRMAECVADALSIMDELGIGAAHVVGHDWGAVVVWHLAARHPDRVRTLTAISVPHPLAMAVALAEDPDQRERSAYVNLFREDGGRAETMLLEDGARRLRRLFTPVDPEAYVVRLLDPDALTPPLNWYRALSQDDLAGLGPVTVPTTYLWSDGDVAIGPTAARVCAEHVAADYRFVPLPGVSHWIPDEAPDTVSEVVLARAGFG